MSARRSRGGALALASLLALTGCGGSDKSDKPQPSPSPVVSYSAPADPVAAFKDAAARTAGTATTFTIETDLGALGSQKGTGATDPATKAIGYHADLNVNGQTAAVDAIIVGSDLYLKMQGLTASDRWAHVDMTKVKSLAKLGLDKTGNPTGLAAVPDQVVSATRPSPGVYTGTLDRTQQSGASEALKSVPFDAKANAQGYITELAIRNPPVGSAPASTATMHFADFGNPLTINRPDSSDVEQAPDSVYQTLQ